MAPLTASILIIFLFLIPICFANAETRNVDLTRHHPTRIISLLIETCRKNEESCPMSIESTAQFISNVNELVLNFEQHYDEHFLYGIEKLSKHLGHCKDVICLMEFEKTHGKHFITAIQKAANILSSVPEVEKFAWEKVILQPPPYF